MARRLRIEWHPGRKVTARHEVNCRCQKGCPEAGVRAKRVTLVSLP